jgi:hypothetical protein
MSKSFLISTLVIFALLQIIAWLLFWFSINRTIWNLETVQQNIVNYLQLTSKPLPAPSAKP